jgi:uncharacterized protein
MKRVCILLAILALGLFVTPALPNILRGRIFPAESTRPDPMPWKNQPAQEVMIKTKDGLTHKSWYFPGTTGRLIIFFHGNGRNQHSTALFAQPLANLGDAVLIAAYRGYGGNPGKPSESGLYADAEATLELAKSLGFDAPKTVLIGYSLGSAVAIELSKTHEFAGLITIGAFSSMREMVPKAARFLLKDKFDSISKVATIGEPMIVFHGDQDEVVPYEHAKALLSAARGVKRMVTMTGTPHHFNMDAAAPFLKRAIDALHSGNLSSLDFLDPEKPSQL